MNSQEKPSSATKRSDQGPYNFRAPPSRRSAASRATTRRSARLSSRKLAIPPKETIAPSNQNTVDESSHENNTVGDKGLINNSNVASQRSRAQIEDSSAETQQGFGYISDSFSQSNLMESKAKPKATSVTKTSKSHNSPQDLSANRERLDAMLVDEASVNVKVEAENLGVTGDPRGAESMSAEQEKIETNQSRKESKKREKKELKRRANAIKHENFKLTRELVTLSESCQEIKEENDKLLEELALSLGPEAISELIAMAADINNQRE